MKKGVIFVIFLVVFSSLSFAKIVDIPKVSEGEEIPLPLVQEEEEIVRYYYSGNSLLKSVSGEESKFYYQDRLGSNRVSVNQDGEVSNFKSLPYGQIIDDGIQYGFTGKEKDESGLHYFGARYYDSDLGKFASVDPVQENQPYSYVGNNPMMFVDPTGMDDYPIPRGWEDSPYYELPAIVTSAEDQFLQDWDNEQPIEEGVFSEEGLHWQDLQPLLEGQNFGEMKKTVDTMGIVAVSAPIVMMGIAEVAVVAPFLAAETALRTTTFVRTVGTGTATLWSSRQQAVDHLWNKEAPRLARLGEIFGVEVTKSREGLRNLNEIARTIMSEGISAPARNDPTKVFYYMKSFEYSSKGIKAPAVIWQNGVQSVQLMKHSAFIKETLQ